MSTRHVGRQQTRQTHYFNVNAVEVQQHSWLEDQKPPMMLCGPRAKIALELHLSPALHKTRRHGSHARTTPPLDVLS